MFKPANGVKARWRVVYGHVVGKELGWFISYEELETLLSITDRHAIQDAVARTSRELKRILSRTMRAEYGKGYCIDYSCPGSFENTATHWEKERVRSQENRWFKKGKGMVLKCTWEDLRALQDLYTGVYTSLHSIMCLLASPTKLTYVSKEWGVMRAEIDEVLLSASPQVRAVVLADRELWVLLRQVQKVIQASGIKLK